MIHEAKRSLVRAPSANFARVAVNITVIGPYSIVIGAPRTFAGNFVHFAHFGRFGHSLALQSRHLN